MTQSLLPPQNTTPWELAVSETSAESRPIPYELLKKLWDPRECPEQFLPYLARALSVDVWNDEWSIDKKREVTAKAKEHHRAKGSEWLLGEYARLIGAELERYIVRPQGLYAVEGWTDEERAEILARLSYVRIQRHYPVDIEADGLFAGEDFFGDAFYDLEPGHHGYRKHAVLVAPDGVETDLTLDWQLQVSETGEAVEIETITLPAEPDAGFYNGVDYAGVDFYDIDRVKERTIQTETPGPYSYTYGRQQLGFVFPQGKQVQVQPDIIVEPAYASDCSTFAGVDHYGDTFYMSDEGWQQVFERYWIHDPNVIVDPIETGGCYYGDARYGWPAFTAEVHVAMPGYQPEWGADEWYGVGFYHPPELEGLEQLIDVINASKALGDKVELQTSTHRWPRFGDRLPLDGSWKFGEMIKDT